MPDGISFNECLPWCTSCRKGPNLRREYSGYFCINSLVICFTSRYVSPMCSSRYCNVVRKKNKISTCCDSLRPNLVFSFLLGNGKGKGFFLLAPFMPVARRFHDAHPVSRLTPKSLTYLLDAIRYQMVMQHWLRLLHIMCESAFISLRIRKG